MWDMIVSAALTFKCWYWPCQWKWLWTIFLAWIACIQFRTVWYLMVLIRASFQGTEEMATGKVADKNYSSIILDETTRMNVFLASLCEVGMGCGSCTNPALEKSHCITVSFSLLFHVLFCSQILSFSLSLYIYINISYSVYICVCICYISYTIYIYGGSSIHSFIYIYIYIYYLIQFLSMYVYMLHPSLTLSIYLSISVPIYQSISDCSIGNYGDMEDLFECIWVLSLLHAQSHTQTGT